MKFELILTEIVTCYECCVLKSVKPVNVLLVVILLSHTAYLFIN